MARTYRELLQSGQLECSDTRNCGGLRGSKFGAAPPLGVLEVTRKVLLGCLLCFHLLNITGARSPYWRVGRRGDRASSDWNLWTSGASGGGIPFSADRSSGGIPSGRSPPWDRPASAPFGLRRLGPAVLCQGLTPWVLAAWSGPAGPGLARAVRWAGPCCPCPPLTVG